MKYNSSSMDQDLFEGVNFTDFEHETIKEIKEDCIRFSEFFKISGQDYDTTSVTIDGQMFGKDRTYCIHLWKDAIHVQVFSRGRTTSAYLYGIVIRTVDDDKPKFIPYHHSMY